MHSASERPGPEAPPAEFVAIAEALRAALPSFRSELSLREAPAPTRIAPHALTLAVSIDRTDDEIAVGRLVLLHDPAGQEAWNGTYRIACFARAELDAEMGTDPLLPDVTWSWLQDALQEHGAEAEALAGTVTVTRSSRFGALAEAADSDPDPEDADSSEVELRCSWSPQWDDDPARHLRAFCGLLADMAGLPPQLPGVVPISSRR